MNRNIFVVAMTLFAASLSPAKAQVVLDMSLITCKQWMESDAERRSLIGSWMSGYFSASKNLNMLDFRYLERNMKVVLSYCKKRRAETLMSAIQKNAR